MILLIVPCIVLGIAWWLTGRLSDPKSVLYHPDHPNERSLHHRPTARTGGLAVLASAGIGVGLVAMTDHSMSFGAAEWSILGATVLLAGVSWCDDRWMLPAAARFCIHAVVATGVVVGADAPLHEINFPFGVLQLGWWGGPLTVLFLVWMANLYNFMDGMDGFAGGMTMLGFAFLSYFGWRSGHTFVFATGMVLSASAAGFLFHNFPPARIFMGDVGSVPIGFLCGALALLGIRTGSFDLWVPVVLFSPFVVDATVTLVRRIAERKKVWEAHRTHYYQRLVLAGWGHRRTVLVEYGLMLLCGALAVLYHQGDEVLRTGVLIAVAMLYGGFIAGVQMVERRFVS